MVICEQSVWPGSYLGSNPFPSWPMFRIKRSKGVGNLVEHNFSNCLVVIEQDHWRGQVNRLGQVLARSVGLFFHEPLERPIY